MDDLGIDLHHQDLADHTNYASELGTDTSHLTISETPVSTADPFATPASLLQAQALQTAQPLALADASATADNATKIVINAAGNVAGGVAPHFKVLVDGKVIGEGSAGTTAKDFTFNANVTADQAHKVQIQYDNDGVANGQDRNLIVNKITINGHALDAADPSVTYDKGALDGKDVVKGQSGMWWNGTLVVAAPKDFFPAATAEATNGATKIVVNAAGNLAGGVAPHFKVLVDGKVIGEGSAGTAAKDYSFTANIAAGQAHKVQVQYDNDGVANGQDRNLIVNKITINGNAVNPTDASVAYDKGALDGKDVIKGQSGMWWDGTLVVSAPKEFFPSSTTTPTTPTTPTAPTTPTTPTTPTAPPAPTNPGGTSDYPATPASQVFYIDATHGNDSNSGHDPNQAWKSLAKVNSTNFAAGSLVLFERGETWTDSLLVSTSGTSDKPIIYGAYGTGADPIIKAKSGASYAVSLNNKDNITFDNLTMTGSNDTGLLLNGGANNVKVTNSQILDNRGSGVVISGTSNNLRIDHSTIDGNGGYGLVHYSADNANQYFTNNIISDNGWRTDAVYSGWNGRILSGEIAGNTIFNNGSGGGDGRSHGLYHDHSQANSTLKIHDNVIYSNPRGAGILAKSSTEIYDNTIYGNSNVGISIGQNQTTNVTYKIYGNEIFNNNGGIMEHLKGSGSITLSLYDNTFYNNNGRAAINIADSIKQTVTNNTISSATKANPIA